MNGQKTDVALIDQLGDEVARVAGPWLGAQAEPTGVVVFQGRVFRHDGQVDDPQRWHEVSTIVSDTPFGCPTCGVERTDYEGEPGRYLPECPSCGSQLRPLPVGLAQSAARQVMVSRDLLAACRSEIRAASGHWAQGFDRRGASIVKHDARGPGATCTTCSILELLDGVLHPAAQGEPVDGRS